MMNNKALTIINKCGSRACVALRRRLFSGTVRRSEGSEAVVLLDEATESLRELSARISRPGVLALKVNLLEFLG